MDVTYSIIRLTYITYPYLFPFIINIFYKLKINKNLNQSTILSDRVNLSLIIATFVHTVNYALVEICFNTVLWKRKS